MSEEKTHPAHPVQASNVVSLAHRRAAVSGAVTVVVPCYNEAERLDIASFREFLGRAPEVRMVFVNDGSRDATLDVLGDLRDMCPRQVEVLNLSRNSGKAEAVRQGLLHAIDSGGALVGYLDADLATPLEAISDFRTIADRFPEISVVFGARRMMLGHRIERTLSRRAVSRICATLARVAVRLPIGDTQCGAKLLRNTPEVRQALARPFTAGWLFDVELFARIASVSATPQTGFYEYPLCEWTEIPGSKVSARAIVGSGFRMLRLIAEMRLGFPPATLPEAAPVAANLVHAPSSAAARAA